MNVIIYFYQIITPLLVCYKRVLCVMLMIFTSGNVIYAGILKDTTARVSIALSGEVTGLDPAQCQTTADEIIQTHLHARLFTYDQNNQLIPDLVSHYSRDQKGLRYIFQLRAQTWRDGHAVTAEDVVFSLKRLFKSNNSVTTLLGFIKNASAVREGKRPLQDLAITVLDAQRFQIDLEYAVPYVLTILAHCQLAPVPRHIVTRDLAWAETESMINNGAFQLEKIDNGRYVLSKNPHFYESDLISIKQLIFLTKKHYQDALVQLGEHIDLIENPPRYLHSALNKFKHQVHVRPVPISYFYYINLAHRSLRERDIRYAMNLMINRADLVSQLRSGFWIPTTRLVPSMSAYPQTKYRFDPLNPVKALAIMSRLGFSAERPLKLTLSYNADPFHQKVAEYLANQWNKIHIHIEFIHKTLPEYYQDLKERRFMLGRFAWKADILTPYNFLFLFDHKNNRYNFGNFEDLMFEQLLARAVDASSETKRMLLFRQAENKLLDDHGIIPLFFYAHPELVNQRIDGYRVDAPINARWWRLK